MTLWGDPWSLFIFIYSTFSLSPFVLFCVVYPRGSGWLIFRGRKKKKHRDTLQDSRRMDQAGILRKFIQEVKAMSEGDEERGEDNFGSDFMVGPN